jgi:hypothetical protein
LSNEEEKRGGEELDDMDMDTDTDTDGVLVSSEFVGPDESNKNVGVGEQGVSSDTDMSMSVGTDKENPFSMRRVFLWTGVMMGLLGAMAKRRR